MSNIEMMKVRILDANTSNALKTSIHQHGLLYSVEISLSIEGKMGMSLDKLNQGMFYKQISIKEMTNGLFVCAYMMCVFMHVCMCLNKK